MTHNLKAFGLALIAVFAMSGLAASAAQATTGEFQFEAGTTKLTVEADPTEPSQVYGVLGDGLSFTCNEGTATVNTFSSTEVTAQNVVYSDTGLTPATNDCTIPTSGSLKVNTNGCDYRFTPGTTVNGNPGEPGTGTTEGTADLICPTGNEITVELLGCTLHIPEQTGVGPVYFHTVKTGTKEEVTVEAKVNHVPGAAHNHGIKYKGTGFFCSTGGVYEEDGSYTGKVTVKGDDKNGNQTNITVT